MLPIIIATALFACAVSLFNRAIKAHVAQLDARNAQLGFGKAER